MIDAAFVEAPRQRTNREENAEITAGETLDGWDGPALASKRREKGTEARWTKNNDETHGRQNHSNADAEGRKRPVYAGSA